MWTVIFIHGWCILFDRLFDIKINVLQSISLYIFSYDKSPVGSWPEAYFTVANFQVIKLTINDVPVYFRFDIMIVLFITNWWSPLHDCFK